MDTCNPVVKGVQAQIWLTEDSLGPQTHSDLQTYSQNGHLQSLVKPTYWFLWNKKYCSRKGQLEGFETDSFHKI